jgi:sugar phosphate isomerase/epimerase
MPELKDLVQVHAPFRMLRHGLLAELLAQGLNPEIYFDARALDELTADEAETVAAALRGAGRRVTFHAPFQDLVPGSTDPALRAATRRRFAQLLELVPAFGPRTVVAHAGYDWRRHAHVRDAWIENSVAFWSEVAATLGRAGCRLMLENVYEHRPAEIGELLARLAPQGVGLCLDLGHLAAFGRGVLGDWLEALGGRIGQLHLHDNRGERDEHLPLGAGGIDFAPLFAYLRAARAAPPLVTLEMHQPQDLAPCLEALARLWPWPA